MEVTSLKEILDTPFNSVHFILKNGNLSADSLAALKELLVRNKGKYDGYIHLINENQVETVIYLGSDMKVNICEELRIGADNIFGSGVTRFI